MSVLENPPFEIGEDMSGYSIDLSVFPSGAAIGVAGGDGGFSANTDGERQIRPGEDAMSGLGSDATGMFNDGPHSADAGGFDSMRGLAGRGQEAVLANEDMYLAQPQVTFDGEVGQGSDELAGDSMAVLGGE